MDVPIFAFYYVLTVSSQKNIVFGNCTSLHLQKSLTCFHKVELKHMCYFICIQRPHSEGFLSKFLLQVGLSWIPKLDLITCCICQSSLCAATHGSHSSRIICRMSVRCVGQGPHHLACCWICCSEPSAWPPICAHRLPAEQTIK